MSRASLISFITALSLGITSLFQLTSAEASVRVDNVSFPAVKTKVKRQVSEEEMMIADPYLCDVEVPEYPEYKGEVLATRMKGSLDQDELFRVKVYVQNRGNVAWFSDDAGCEGMPLMRLGTAKKNDRASVFATKLRDQDSRWVTENRIKMKQPRVNPGDVAVFEFWSKTPFVDDVYVEYFAPVVEGEKWLNDATFPLAIRVGDYPKDYDKIVPHIQNSMAISSFEKGDKSIHVDISDQVMKLKIGNHVMYEFPVSTGAYRTPTPFGTTKITLKQDVRVAYKWPHYVMPRFMMFRAGGYGIHALPSLRNDGGTYWREAFSHIGTRVSHGCIRLLPKHADLAFDFAEVGTPVTVVP